MEMLIKGSSRSEFEGLEAQQRFALWIFRCRIIRPCVMDIDCDKKASIHVKFCVGKDFSWILKKTFDSMKSPHVF